MPGRTAARWTRGLATALAGVLVATGCGPDQLPTAAPATVADRGTPAATASPTTGPSTTGPSTTGAPPRRPTTVPDTVDGPVRPPGPPLPAGRYLDVVFAPSAVEVTRGLVYARATGVDGEPVDLALDLHRPVDDPTALRPLVVLVHGGGFTSGERTALDPYARDLAQRGWAVAAVSYRLSRDVGSDWRGPRVRAAVALARADVAAAVGWLRADAAGWGLDGRRVAVVGYSAGAMTAIELGLHGGGDGPSGEVQAVVAIAGTVVVAGGIGAPAPPMLLLHGDADRAVPLALAESTCALAEAADVACTLTTYPGVGHEIVSSRHSALVEAMARFLVEHLALPVG